MLIFRSKKTFDKKSELNSLETFLYNSSLLLITKLIGVVLKILLLQKLQPIRSSIVKKKR